MAYLCAHGRSVYLLLMVNVDLFLNQLGSSERTSSAVGNLVSTGHLAFLKSYLGEIDHC